METQWKALDGDIIKVNFDASYQQQLPRAIAGIILRNNLRQIMGVCAYPINNIQDPVTAEAHACLQVVIYAEEMGFNNICVEGDALTILKKLQAKEVDRSVIATNKVAHDMAVWGRRCEGPRYWVEEAPPEIERVIATE
ncbi:hypothetical protein Golob_025226 [Gossypium lobatum]|uniref:RNase H type-1 domain-containing protein n=1 Tax=Gossypium lobatum TaxID=34289 RepID=A0A7J8NL40_9ROSI|nr:hypothetical protein [Gossypium lobatum]